MTKDKWDKGEIIAVSILTEKPEEGSVGNDPLRRWAISVLRNPQNPPVLSEAAAMELEMRTIGWRSTFNSDFLRSTYEVERLREAIDAIRRQEQLRMLEESSTDPEIDW
jgi:hypothetical protein